MKKYLSTTLRAVLFRRQVQLRPMAVHALNNARSEVAVALVFEKIPALFDDAAERKVPRAP